MSGENQVEKVISRYNYMLYRNKKNRKLDHAITIAGNLRNHVIALHRRYYRLTGKHIPVKVMQAHIAKLRMGRISKNKKLGREAKPYGKKRTYWQAVSAQSAQDICERVEKGYERFFDNLKAGKPRKVGLPRFKKSHKYTSFTLKTDSWKLHDEVTLGSRTGNPLDKNIRRTGRIEIMGTTYKFVWTRPIRGKIKTVTVKRDATGDIWISFTVEEYREIPNPVSTGKSGGFDFGLKTFLTNDEGECIVSPQFYRQGIHEIQRNSKALSSKQKGSNNRERARLDLARTHRRMANLRENHHWQLAHDLCDHYDVMYFETLNLRGMQRMWGRKIGDLAFADFLKKLQWVVKQRGKRVYQIDQWEATSKTCYTCGTKKEKLGLHERIFECEYCGHVLDRDHNAALNIKKVGTSTFTPRGSKTGERSTRPRSLVRS